MNKRLVDIKSFGNIDAESDELLLKCFTHHPVMKEILESDKFLILGRKGSGKTALFKKILEMSSHDLIAEGYCFNDYPWSYHDLQRVSAEASQERYLNSWRYLILLALSKTLLNRDCSQPWCEEAIDPLRKIEKFVIDSYGSRDIQICEIFNPVKRLVNLKELNVDLKMLKINFVRDELSMENLPRAFHEVNKNLETFVLSSLNPDIKYYLCFDELDITFSPKSEEYQHRLIGLILASRNFINKANSLGKQLKILIFLRSDIYCNYLHFEDKNKITDSAGIEIRWEERKQSFSLKPLMERRIAELLEIDTDGAWDKVFDENTKMRGHQTKYQHILDRTFYRPRDIIKFCNCILEEYKNRKKQLPDSINKFTNEDVNSAKCEYSKFLKKELDDEIHKYYPYYRIYFEILKQIGYQQFTFDEFLKAFEEWQNKLDSNISPLNILEQLYELSIIGYYQLNYGFHFKFKYMDMDSEFNSTATRFRVHWGFVEALGVQKFTRA
jgi:hypothetical protein